MNNYQANGLTMLQEKASIGTAENKATRVGLGQTSGL